MATESVLYAPSLSAALYLLGVATGNLEAEESKQRGPYRKSEARDLLDEIDALMVETARVMASDDKSPNGRAQALEKSRELIARLTSAGWLD